MGNGAQGRDRTADTVIFSHVLYQLSYLGMRASAARSGPYKGAAPYLSSPDVGSCAASGSAGGPGTR